MIDIEHLVTDDQAGHAVFEQIKASFPPNYPLESFLVDLVGTYIFEDMTTDQKRYLFTWYNVRSILNSLTQYSSQAFSIMHTMKMPAVQEQNKLTKTIFVNYSAEGEDQRDIETIIAEVEHKTGCNFIGLKALRDASGKISSFNIYFGDTDA